MSTLSTAPFFMVPGVEKAADWSGDARLFRLPEHLRKRWWNLAAEELITGAEKRPGFAAFLESFRAFAAYKEIPLYPTLTFGVLDRPPGEVAEDLRLRAIANLGDETTKVLLNGTEVSLNPGDAVWANAGAALTPGDTLAKLDLDVLFVIQDA